MYLQAAKTSKTGELRERLQHMEASQDPEQHAEFIRLLKQFNEKQLDFSDGQTSSGFVLVTSLPFAAEEPSPWPGKAEEAI